MEEGGTDISRIRKPRRNRRRKWNKETLEIRIRVSFVVGPKKNDTRGRGISAGQYGLGGREEEGEVGKEQRVKEDENRAGGERDEGEVGDQDGVS